ncbi:S8 family peptidase [Ulvibacter antarcticus]|uniref:S8 family peptidase n=1 Tax=Ulvibacter antarcticus TaxID=442714 RepID=UPI0011C43B74|nr:S8 family serine peptidase [Ulvibacter antarcticus]
MQTKLFFIIFCFFTVVASAQYDYTWFYIRANDTLVQPEFEKVNDELKYVGTDIALKSVLDRHRIYSFKKTYRKARKQFLKRTFFVMCDDESLFYDLLENASHAFISGEIVPEEDKKIYEPNDYGLTSTIGENLGLPANLDYMDYLGMPEAWYYTTGSPETIIGISDGGMDTTDLDFKGKTKIFHKSAYSDGHGVTIASIAAAQGDNAYGIPGVCYDCSIYATRYGIYTNYQQLIELSKAGAKVINCSFAVGVHDQKGQDSINKIFNNGTVIVAAAGNQNWIKSEFGKLELYPASYDNVISVSCINYKYPFGTDNITLEPDKQMYYAENIKHHLARTMGFLDNDTLKSNYNYRVSVTLLNKKVDLLTPSAGLVKYSKFAKEGNLEYIWGSASSPTAPAVTGAVGLMFSLYPCLPADEVETILKFTASNIDYVPQNIMFVGNYGAGALHVGDAVEMVYQLYSKKQTAVIKNQNFSRWDFKLTSLSEAVEMQNQKFTDSSTLKLTARRRIVLKQNTTLKPGIDGNISLKIDTNLQKECDLQLRDPSIEDGN